MSELFEQTAINGMALKNRFVRSATYEGMATEDGAVTEKLVDLMGELAVNNVGLIISGHAYVSPEGQAGFKQTGVYDDALVPGLKRLADGVHTEGGKIVLQIAHSGGMADPELTGREALGPSIIYDKDTALCREMTLKEIDGVVTTFEKAAIRAKQAGLDGVQIHAAHGYLLSQFLSPFFNRRTDAYGGSLENRARIVLSVLERIRKAVGDHYPVLIKMNAEDFVQNGLTQDEMLRVAAMLESAGIDAIELSGGTGLSGKYTPIRKGKMAEGIFYEDAARRFKEKIRVPLILVGGIRSYETARSLVEEGVTDYVAMSRPLIREPDLVNRWKLGDRAPSACVSDNLCFLPTREGKGIYCVTRERQAAT